MSKTKLNPNEYLKWCEAQLADYFSKSITDDVTDDQAEAIEYLINIKGRRNHNGT